jgi:uncharacterized protein with ATP-grasp and redox domains
VLKILPECHGCLLGLIDQAASLATDDEVLRAAARREARKVLDERFGDGSVPARIATVFHEAIKQATANLDPFLSLKRREIAFARQVAERMGLGLGPLSLREAALVAVAGNALDFFREHDVVGRELTREVTLAVDDLDEAFGGLRPGQGVLYLADNAGEQFFDAPLLAALCAAGCRVSYGVKGRPVQNDLCLDDVVPGVLPAGVAVVSTGGGAVGLDLASASAEFRGRLAEADLVIAKGMGHYETVDELAGKRALLLLKAKCQPVAEGLGVAKDSFVALLREPPRGDEQ